jgi:SpoVK/Ycf46/Vps4 family AAA+-type ATPase
MSIDQLRLTVIAFLRKMEYFRGILFLTTNRVGHIDEAFKSRLHVVVHFPSLNDSQRHEIWKAFFNKLKKEQGNHIKIGHNAQNYVLQSSEELNIKLNGREIRNVLHTAIALARYEASKDSEYNEGDIVFVESEHFERVLTMFRSFGDYLDSIKGDSQEKRAQNVYLRNDEFDPEPQT